MQRSRRWSREVWGAHQEETCLPVCLSPRVFSLSAPSLVSLVIIFLSFSCLFFAMSWIICVSSLSPDDSCAVGLQSVFQIRWIMNKPRQQKSPTWALPLLVCPCSLACQPVGTGQVSRKVFLMLKLSWTKCVYRRCENSFIWYLLIFQELYLPSFPVLKHINQCFFWEARC